MPEVKKFVKKPPEDPAVISKRWDKKKEQIEVLSNNIRKLRYNVSTDMKSDNEKIALTALVVAIILRTAERVGNIDSAKEGHYGVTCFKKKHVKIDGNKITFEYTGKSGVEHEKSFSDERIADAIKKAVKNSHREFIFVTSDGFKISADRVNRYLSDFDIRSKDIRGYSANKLMIDKLDGADKENIEDEKKRKKFFLKSLREVAKKVGHGSGTLRKQYLIPELEGNFIVKANVIDLTDRDKYETGGSIGLNQTKVKEAKRKRDVQVLKMYMVGGRIADHDLKKVLNRRPFDTIEAVGDIKLKKVYRQPFYQRIMEIEVIPNEQTPYIEPMMGVKEFIKSNKEELNNFFEFAKSRWGALGLAANQVKIDGERWMERVVAVNINMKWVLAINPSISQYIGDKEQKQEGCLTWKGKKTRVKRSPKVIVSYCDIDGNKIKQEYSGLEAQIWQHECDHLNGVKQIVD